MITNDQKRRILIRDGFSIRHRPTFTLPIHKFTRRKYFTFLNQHFILASLVLLYFFSNKINAFQFLDDPGNLSFSKFYL